MIIGSPQIKNISFTLPLSNFRSQKSVFDIYTQPFITGIVKERFEIMCQVGEYTFEITIDVVNMVERRTTQSENVEELRFSKNIGWSQFAYLKLCKTRSGFSIPLDFEIAKVACILKMCMKNFYAENFSFDKFTAF